MSQVIVSHLSKRYGNHTAVDDISFTIEKGHVYGFLGPNGAGKSTTMNILTGCLAASSGQVMIDGHDIFEESKIVKKQIGYLPEQPPLYQEMTVDSYLQFVAEAKEVKKEDRERQVVHVMEVTGVEHVRGRLIKNLSKGYKQRIGIAQALLGEPELIILDEPTVGLDPRQIIEIRDLIRKLGEEHTVILSSHILSEVRSVCDQIIIISEGKLVASDTPDNLEKIFAGKTTVHAVVKAEEEEVKKILSSIDDIISVTYKALGQEAEVAGTAQVDIETSGKREIGEDLFFAFAAAGQPILRLSVSKADLEEVFLALTSGEVNGDAGHIEA